MSSLVASLLTGSSAVYHCGKYGENVIVTAPPIKPPRLLAFVPLRSSVKAQVMVVYEAWT